ncbi:MAG TPA: metallopeptidase TldD-related protein [Pilimelia sp.]|nr:metallopeptidase TldD-related protein [Pilimelia sp.]
MTAELDLARRVVDMARTAAGADAQAEVLVNHTELALTRFANSYIHQNVADATTTVRLRVHVDGRTVAGSTTLADPDGLAALVARTLDAAKLCPPDPGWPGLAPPTPLAGAGAWDEATAHAGPGDRAERVRAFVAAAGGSETAGYCRTVYLAAGFANSAGQAITGQASEAAMDAVARVAGSDGVARLASARLADIDGAILGSRAAAKARAGREPVELPPGRYEVVLEPTAVADILQHLSQYGFDGRAYLDRRSFVSLGERQFDPSITIVDDPLGVTGLGLPFDADGTPKQALTLVAAGITREVAHDRRTAAEAGAASTGHAVPGASWPGPHPVNPRIESATGGPATAADGIAHGPAADAGTAALLAGVERGLLVTDFWYTRMLDPRSLVVTGLTRNGVWLVERGEITAAVRDLRFTQSYPRALAEGGVRQIGPSTTTVPNTWEMAWWTAPALHLAAWNFTGGASG